MKKIAFAFLLPLGLGLLLLPSCSKEGPGGKAAISGTVKHHYDSIAGAEVYIKYGTKEFPGSNVTYYDASTTADANAYYEFVDLKKGDYYLFGVGFDSASFETVTGGIPVEIKKKTETVQTDVPVTEP